MRRSRATSSSGISLPWPRTTGPRSRRHSPPTWIAWARTATNSEGASRTPHISPTRSRPCTAINSTSTGSMRPERSSPSSCAKRSTTQTNGSRRARPSCSTPPAVSSPRSPCTCRPRNGTRDRSLGSVARMTSPLCTLDLARMRRERIDKLRAAMAASEIDVLVLCLQSNISYATGARVPTSDHVRAGWWRAVAIVERDDPWPHLFTEFPEGAPSELPNDHLHPAVEVEAAAGAAELVETLPAGQLALDDAPFPLWQALGARAGEVIDGALALAPAKLTKTLDELECIRQAQAINERAMRTVRESVVAGVQTTTLSGIFLRSIAELGATGNVVDPVFNVMPMSVADGPYSVTGDPVFPLPTRPRELQRSDVLWIDTGISLN